MIRSEEGAAIAAWEGLQQMRVAVGRAVLQVQCPIHGRRWKVPVLRICSRAGEIDQITDLPGSAGWRGVDDGCRRLIR